MATAQLSSLSKLMNIPIDSHYDESYIIRLASMNLHELIEEPSRLEVKADTLEREIQGKAIEQNEVFEKAQKCFSDVVDKMGSLTTAVSVACDFASTVDYSSKSLSREAKETYEKFIQSKKALKYHSQLLELLEMPQLMDTCIRNNLHEEGLVLLRHANSLYNEHFHGDPALADNGAAIILNIFNEMVSVGEQQELLLLRELETDITVPRCLQIMSYLEENLYLRKNNGKGVKDGNRSIHVGELLNEEELVSLKQAFLNARNQFYQKKCSLLPEYDHSDYMNGFIKIFKEKATNLIAQYQAVFGSAVNDPIFHRYITMEVSSFLEVYDKHMKQIVSGSVLASIFREIVYMCDGLSIIHCNIFNIIFPVMLHSVITLMDDVVEKEFDTQIQSSLFWMKSIFSTNVYRLKSADSFSIYRNNEKSTEKELLPSYLMEVPILAKLLNDFLSCLNELRHVALRGCAKEICDGLNPHLVSIANSILKSNELMSQIMIPKNRNESIISNSDHYDIICTQYVYTVLPILQIHLQSIFNTSEDLIDIKLVESVFKERSLTPA